MSKLGKYANRPVNIKVHVTIEGHIESEYSRSDITGHKAEATVARDRVGAELREMVRLAKDKVLDGWSGHLDAIEDEAEASEV